MTHRILPAAATALLLTVLWACGKMDSDAASSNADQPIVEVKIDSVPVGSLPQMLEATGVARALRESKVSTPIEGKIKSLRVFEGDVVRRDEFIAVIETKESLAAVRGAEMLLAQAGDAAARARAQAALALAQKNKTIVEVHSPLAGAVTARSVNDGDLVQTGEVLATLIDLHSLYFFASLPVKQLTQIRPGQEAFVTFESWRDRLFRCVVENIKPQIDVGGQMVEAKLRFVESPNDLRSEMFGTVAIKTGEHPRALLVPDRAVLRDDETDMHTVVEAVGDTLAVIRPVEIGIETPSTVEISGPGIRAGMHLIVEGHYALPDSTRIRLFH